MLKGIRIALGFLTRLPIQGDIDEKALAQSIIYYPLIGLFLGALLVGCYLIIQPFLPPGPIAFLLVVVLIILTGNLHLDGLMDTADGIFSGRSRQGTLEIMRDSRMGAHGVTAGMLIILGKYIFLAHLPDSIIIGALISMPLMGRWIMVYSLALYPYAREGEGLGRVFAERTGVKEISIATLITIGILLGIWGPQGMGYLALWGLFGVLFVRFCARKLGGVTGDTCGAAGEFIETIVLLTLLVMN
jgi:adenosylcobinamide-GDP ribazoletransferase